MSLCVAVLKEQAEGERRVALDPVNASKLAKRGLRVLIQRGAGDAAGFSDAQYADAELIDDEAKALAEADIYLWVQAPSTQRISRLKPGAVALGQVYAHRQRETVAALQQANTSCLAMELVPRITRAQSMDVLSSQATVAGYKAVLRAAWLSPRLFPMLTTAAGTLRPSTVVVIGAGVAGLQAIATARRLGARVEAYDIRAAAREQVESLGARMIDTGVNAEGEGGYARELTEEEKQQQAAKLAEHLAKADAVISTASVPGRPAPKIITEDMVAGMKPGAVIVDLSAESGGNCSLTRPGSTVLHQGVTVDGPLNLASQAAVHASEMYSKNLLNLLDLLLQENGLKIDREDDVIAGCLLTHDGEVVHAATAKSLSA
jgi:NAD(P) transhydrogenase subunit alpha